MTPSLYTIALGGVPTGRIKEHDADIPTASIKISFGIPKDTPNSIGTIIPVNPVLLIKLVRIIVIVTTKNKRTIGVKFPKIAISFQIRMYLLHS